VRRATFLASVRADLTDILAYVAESSGSVAVAQAFGRAPPSQPPASPGWRAASDGGFFERAAAIQA